jgi:hypothetical protein
MDEADNDAGGGSSKAAGKRRRTGRRAAEGAGDPTGSPSADIPAAESPAESAAAPPPDTPIADLMPGTGAPPAEALQPSSASAEQPTASQLVGEAAPEEASPSSSPLGTVNEREPRGRRRWWPAAAAVILVVAAAAVALSLALKNGRDTAAFDRRLAAAETQVAKLASQPQPAAADPKEVAALASRVAALETQVGALANRPQPAAADPKDATALNERLAVGERAAARIDDVAKRVDAIEAAVARLGAPDKRAEAAEEIRRQVADLTARLTQLETAPPRTSEVDPALAFRISLTETEVKSLFSRLNELTRRVDEVATAARDADRHADAATAAAAARPAPVTVDGALRRAFAAAALSAAVARGDPFAAELAALKTVAGDKAAALAPLEPFAANGVPSPATLSRELTALLPAIRAKAAPPEGEGGLIEHLQSSARHLVRVRRVGEAPGEDTAAVLARLEAKAAQADVGGAMAELGKLPAAARAPAEAWMQKVAQRNAALETARALAAEALAALAKAPQ